MTKKTQRKPKNRRGPTVRQVGSAIYEQYPSIAQQAARIGQGLVASAVKLGEHRARASLLAPMFKYMRATIDGQSDGTVLNNTDCHLLLACLAEAGYVPQDEHKAHKAMWGDTDTSWSGVPGDRCNEKASDVAKAA